MVCAIKFSLLAPALAWTRSAGGWLLRAGYAVFRQIKEAGLDYRAMSLVYISLLALIPLLAVSFSMLKAFGADAYLEPLLLEVLKPLRGNTQEVAETLLESVGRLDVRVLGSVGLLSLLYTSVSLLDKIEDSFNHIWRKRTKSSRSLVRRFSDYLTFILVGPLLVFLGFGGLNEIFRRINEFHLLEGRINPLLLAFQAILPYVFTVAAFAFLFQVIPDVQVKIRSALFGGLLAGFSWKLVGWVFGTFMAGSAQYHAVYSTFAILILFMIWLYLSWLIVLLGVQVTFFHQHPRYLFLCNGQARLSARLSERLGLLLLVLVGRRFLQGATPWSAQELTTHLALPYDCVDELLSVLSTKGLLMQLGEEGGVLVPGRDLATIRVVEVVEAVRSDHEGDFLLNLDLWAEPAVDGLVERFEQAALATAGAATIRDLLGEDAE